MAWTAPATWNVSEIVLASKMNAHVRDNLKYLKGQAGAVVLEDRLEIPATSGTTGTGLRFATSGTSYGTVQGFNDGTNSYIFFGTNRQFDGTGWQQLNARAASLIQLTQDVVTFSTFPAASSVPAERMRITNAGNVGIGTTAPAGALHVTGAGSISGAGFAIGSVAAVTTIQTVFAAGTIARACVVSFIDRNNTGGAYTSSTNLGVIALSGALTYTNTDTITLAVTAGGALTAQRTTGTNGSHDIVIHVIFF